MRNSKFLVYGAGLIAAYLVLKNFKGAVAVGNTAGTGSVNVIKAFQGR